LSNGSVHKTHPSEVKVPLKGDGPAEVTWFLFRKKYSMSGSTSKLSVA
jgi:hypothetical protein